MNKSSVSMKSLVAVMALVSSLASAPAVASNVTIYADGKYMLSTQVSTIEVYDEICKVSKGSYRLHGNQKIAISVCAGGTGKGSVLYRNLSNGQTGWTRDSLMNHGESFYP